jgi:hypothetical protein
MNHTITVSEALYERLEAEARRRGIKSVEELLEVWQEQQDQDDAKQRHEAVRQIDALREHLLAKYGEMPDSVPLLQEDRARS